MSTSWPLLFTFAQVLACAAFVVIGLYVIVKTETAAAKVAGYMIVAVFSGYAIMAMLTSGAGGSTSTSSNSDVECWNFRTREVAQTFYDTVQESRPGYYWPIFDPDQDGVVCEDGVEYPYGD